MSLIDANVVRDQFLTDSNIEMGIMADFRRERLLRCTFDEQLSLTGSVDRVSVDMPSA